MAFREDESRIRTGHAAHNMSILRRLALNLRRRETTAKGSIAAKRKQSGWNDSHQSQGAVKLECDCPAPRPCHRGLPMQVFIGESQRRRSPVGEQSRPHARWPGRPAGPGAGWRPVTARAHPVPGCRGATPPPLPGWGSRDGPSHRPVPVPGVVAGLRPQGGVVGTGEGARGGVRVHPPPRLRVRGAACRWPTARAGLSGEQPQRCPPKHGKVRRVALANGKQTL